MPGQAVWPESSPVVFTVQLAGVEFTTKLAGNVTCTLASVWANAAAEGVAQTRPPVVVESDMRSKRTKASVSPAADAVEIGPSQAVIMATLSRATIQLYRCLIIEL